VFYVKWRSLGDGGTQVKRRLGPAWLERGVSRDPRRASRFEGWVRRRGRAVGGALTEQRALGLIPDVIEEAEALRAEARVAYESEDPPLFEEISEDWLLHRITVGGIKRTTQLNYEAMLRRPDAPAKKRGRAPAARLMAKWGGREAASITTREVARWLTELDRDPALTPRAVNLYRQVMLSIYVHACREDTFGLAFNPVAGTEKRREPDPKEIITYTAAEVEAIARAAAAGAHRDVSRVRLGDEELDARRLEDEQDACLILVAAFCGLRMGECLGLRWRHVMWDAHRLHVQLNYVLGHEDSPKGRRGRTVPLADQPAQALARLSQRPMFTRPADLVFCSRVGAHLDGSALRRRYIAARDAVATGDPDMPRLRFHDLRHTFGTPEPVKSDETPRW
jgi:integrase